MYVYADETKVKRATVSKEELKAQIADLEKKVYGHACTKSEVALLKKRSPFSVKRVKKG
ncbi:MAG: hypothetical protein PHP50_12335 [Lachnospiraceae bacterium]|nr:hypothetical protein [Lachnospiraceae bacterium]